MVADVRPKERVQIHIIFLKSLLEAGIEVTKIHRVVSFKQKCWIKPFVLENTALRDKARDSFEKSFYKLIINSQVLEIRYIEGSRKVSVRWEHEQHQRTHERGHKQKDNEDRSR